MFCLQRAEKPDKEDGPILANGHANTNGDCQTKETSKKLLNGHANGSLANGSAKSSNGYSSSGYKNGAVLANGVNGHTELTQRKVK